MNAVNLEPKLGGRVFYWTRPCPKPYEGPDVDLYSNYAEEDRAKSIARPALVTRVWGGGSMPALNLRVLADSDGVEDAWRTSVPFRKDATSTAGFCWSYDA